MADAKITQLPEVTQVNEDDVLTLVTNTSTTPVSKKVTAGRLVKELALPDEQLINGTGIYIESIPNSDPDQYSQAKISALPDEIQSFVNPVYVLQNDETINANVTLSLPSVTGILKAGEEYVGELHMVFETDTIVSASTATLQCTLNNISLNYVGNWDKLVVHSTDSTKMEHLQDASAKVQNQGIIIDFGADPSVAFGGGVRTITSNQNFYIKNNTAQPQNFGIDIFTNLLTSGGSTLKILKGSYLKMIKVVQ
jgi:hypothetical protein